MLAEFNKALSTPISDLLHGRITGDPGIKFKLNIKPKSLIAAADLPDDIKSLLVEIIRDTRLWRREKISVAQELMAHFVDGLAAGESADHLIEHFGDPRTAAKLISRARLRNRPLIWKAFRWCVRSIVFVVVCYTGLSIYFYSGKSTPKINYLAEMNAAIEKIPPADRAWPLYRDALVTLQKSGLKSMLNYSADGVHWPEIASSLATVQPTIAEVRRAAALPAMGFVLGPGGSMHDVALFSGQPSRDDSLVTLAIPHLNFLRILAMTLAADAKLAAQQHDGLRCGADITATIHLAEQQHRESHLLVGDLVAMGIMAVAFDRLDETLSTMPETFSDQQLIDLAHLLARPRDASDLITFRGEQLLFRDIVQHAFTDDGNGDGRLAGNGLRTVMDSASHTVGQRQSTSVAEVIAQPAALLILPSRRSLVEADDLIMDAAENSLHRPLRDADPDAMEHELQRIEGSTPIPFRFALLQILVPSLHRARMTPERLLGERDGLLVGIALELYRRNNHQYPATLQSLLPAFLPQIPADRITGDAVRYRLIDQKPRIYSVGIDRKDDGGRVPVMRGNPTPWEAAGWGPSANQVDGDWVLYPLPRFPVNEPD